MESSTLRRGIVMPLVASSVFFAVLATLLVAQAQSPGDDLEWQKDWALQRGFNIEIDSQGFQFPTSIAFVPNPGPDPKDPLYFVTELKGRVSVVSNDRTVSTFAEDFFSLRPDRVVPKIDEEVGMGALCLDPEHGYVFVTFSYHDRDNILRNNVARFQSSPGTFSLSPSDLVDFSEIFAPYQSIPSHQIGGCQVSGGLLYVSVGHAGKPFQSQSLDSLMGKVIRMTLDGKPEPSNPFYFDDSILRAANFIFASGLRNPFGLTTVEHRVFVADNGPDVDRFVEVDPGENFLWEGSNLSFGARSDALFTPGRGVAQLERYPRDSELFPPRFRDSFFMTMTGNPVRHRAGFPAIWMVPYDLESSQVTGVPEPLLRYQGSQAQVVSGLAFGPDGLYISPLIPNKQGFTAVLKIKFNPDAEYPFNLAEESNPVLLMNTRGCFACHTLFNNGGGTVGPALDPELLVPRILARLNSREYVLAMEELDRLQEEPFLSFRDARQHVQLAQGQEKVRLWVVNRILEPRFDNPNAKMPSLGLSREQAASIADYLMGQDQDQGPPPGQSIFSKINIVSKLADFVEDRVPIASRANARKYLASFFGLGVLAGVLGTLFLVWFWKRVRRSRSRSPLA